MSAGPLHLDRLMTGRLVTRPPSSQQAIDIRVGDAAVTAGNLVESFEHLGSLLHGRLVTLDMDGIITGRDPDAECRPDSAQMLVAGSKNRQQAF